MGSLILGVLLFFLAVIFRTVASGQEGRAAAGARILRLLSYGFVFVGALSVVGSMVKVIEPGQVGVQHAFGTVSPTPLLPGIRFVSPWSSVERYSTREEQWPAVGETMARG